MSPNGVRLRRCLIAGVTLAFAMVNAGCGPEDRYPVQGRVLLKGAPLKGKEGAVVLKPDASKGNKTSVSAAGTLQRDGSFTVQDGAPLGWYKVIVIATDPGANPNDDLRRVLHRRYEKEDSTPLTIEVIADPGPGRYDLKLSP